MGCYVCLLLCDRLCIFTALPMGNSMSARRLSKTLCLSEMFWLSLADHIIGRASKQGLEQCCRPNCALKPCFWQTSAGRHPSWNGRKVKPRRYMYINLVGFQKCCRRYRLGQPWLQATANSEVALNHPKNQKYNQIPVTTKTTAQKHGTLYSSGTSLDILGTTVFPTSTNFHASASHLCLSRFVSTSLFV